MLQGIETVNNYANINTNKNVDSARRMVSNPNSDGVVVASQDVAAQKIKKIERSEKTAEARNQKKDKLLEFLERKVGRGEVLSHGENLYVMGKKTALYEQSMNMQKLRDRIMKRFENKSDNESIDQIYKELTEELKKEYGITDPSSGEMGAEATETITQQNSEEYIRMANALQIGFADYAAAMASEDVEEEPVDLTEEVQLLGSGSVSEDEKTALEKEVEARYSAESEAIFNAKEKLSSKMFSKLDGKI